MKFSDTLHFTSPTMNVQCVASELIHFPLSLRSTFFFLPQRWIISLAEIYNKREINWSQLQRGNDCTIMMKFIPFPNSAQAPCLMVFGQTFIFSAFGTFSGAHQDIMPGRDYRLSFCSPSVLAEILLVWFPWDEAVVAQVAGDNNVPDFIIRVVNSNNCGQEGEK